MIFLLLLVLEINAETCNYNYSDLVLCENANLSRNIRSLLLKDGCEFQVEDWKKFSKDFPELKNLKFAPPLCKNCLKMRTA